MKRLGYKGRQRIILLSRIRSRHRLKRYGRCWVSPESRYVLPGDRIKAPPRFNLIRGDAVQVVKFLRAIATAVLRKNIAVTIDFRSTESFYPAGTILLFAEISRIVGLSPLPKPISIRDPVRRRPREVLKQIGIHALTGDRSDVVPEREDVVFWKAIQGKDQSGDTLGPILEYVADRVNKDHARQVEVAGIWRGLSEAVANTVEHAYAEDRGDGFPVFGEAKWWMFTQIRGANFSAAVCDLGCGYRASTRRTIPEEIRARLEALFFGVNQDSAAIKIAMEYGRTSTDKANRGKGSRDALSVLNNHGRGELHILSKAGGVRYELGVDGKLREESYPVDIDIKGTIIWWNLPLQEQS